MFNALNDLRVRAIFFLFARDEQNYNSFQNVENNGKADTDTM